MSSCIVCGVNITEGTASRYIKPSWIVAGSIDTTAFDLRERTPPETFVSLFIAAGESNSEKLQSAYAEIARKFKKLTSGSIALLDVAECLEEVNDEPVEFIHFVDKKLPHCGLVYVTNDLAKIHEAKTTLCFLARQSLHHIANMQPSVTNLVSCGVPSQA